MLSETGAIGLGDLSGLRFKNVFMKARARQAKWFWLAFDTAA